MVSFLLVLLTAISIWSIFQINNLKQELEKLKNSLGQLAVKPDQAAAASTATVVDSSNQAGLPPVPHPPDRPSSELEHAKISESSSIDSLLDWLRTDWQMKVGGFFIVLGFAWLVSYAFINNWIGPVGRVSLGLIAGHLILVAGHHWLVKHPHQGLFLELLGTVIVLISVFAAQNIYHQMFPLPAAMALSVLPVLFLSYSSLVHRDRWLSLVALLAAAIVPLLMGDEQGSFLSLQAYLLSFLIGTLWLSYQAGWDFLVPVAWTVIMLYNLSIIEYPYKYIINHLTPLELLQARVFAVIYTTLLYTTNVRSVFSRPVPRQTQLVAGLLVSLSGWWWVRSLVPTEWQALSLLLLALLLLTTAKLLFDLLKNPYPVYIYAAGALLSITIAVNLAVVGDWQQTIAYATVALLSVWVGLNYFGSKIGLYLLFYFALPMILSLDDFFSSDWSRALRREPYYRPGIGYLTSYPTTSSPTVWQWLRHALALAYMGMSTLTIGLYLRQQAKKLAVGLDSQFYRRITNTFLVTAAVYGLMFTWRVLPTLTATISPDLGRMLALVLFAVAGIYTYFKGQTSRSQVVYRFGQVLTLFVIGRLLLIEVWDMNLGLRIVTFFGIGVVFILAVMINRSLGLQAKITQPTKSDEN